MIHTDARIADANAVLSRFMEDEISSGIDTDEMLLDRYTGEL